MRGEVVWSPPPDAWTRCRLGQFRTAAEARSGRSFPTCTDLLAWSVSDLEAFWATVADWASVPWTTKPSRMLAGGDRTLPGARWFPDGTLNYAEVALEGGASAHDVAIVGRSQTRDRTTMTWAELRTAVSRCRVGLQRLEVGRGDRVAAYLPNIPETIVAFLATASLGAVWCSCAPEFGTRAVLDRLAPIEPKVLLAVDGYTYGAKSVDRTDAVRAIVEGVPSIGDTVGIRYAGHGEDGWRDLLAEAAPLEFEAVPADHPLYILFSSGTTGLPKPIVHGHAGIALEHIKTLALHHDLGAGDRFSWFTTTGWMMWNFLVSGLLVDSTIVLFDGDPGFPDLRTLWALAADEDLTVFGASAPFLMACRKADLDPASELDLGGLRQVGSTGAPLPADGFRWVREHVGREVQVASISGGTDVCTAFVGMTPVEPVRAGEITGALLGCDVRAVRPDGSPCPSGEQGELVLAAPLPSMPVGFWGDVDGRRLRGAYFEDLPGLWRHGDWITFFDDGACIITGRSDATLNRDGVRLGTSDFYAVVESLPEVVDSLVVHLDHGPHAGDLVLFVVLADGRALDDPLRDRIASELRTQLSPRHRPDRIEAVPAIPRTLSGKKLEVPVKRILQGDDPTRAASVDALIDPAAIDAFVRFA